MQNSRQANAQQAARIATLIFFWAPITFFSLLLVKNTIPYFSFSPEFSFLEERQFLMNSWIWKGSFYVHILAGVFCIMTALTQFSSWILKKRSAIHVWAGKIYVFVVLLLGAPTGLYMAFFAKGGYGEKGLFLFMAIFWFFTTWKGLKTARNKKFLAHSYWMIRSYSMALTAVTFRIYHIIFFAFGMHHHLNYEISLWLSVLGNMLAAEAIIYSKSKHYLSSIKV